jgi:hypothetical protein
MLTFEWTCGSGRRFIYRTADPRAALAFVRWCRSCGFACRALAADRPAGSVLRVG